MGTGNFLWWELFPNTMWERIWDASSWIPGEQHSEKRRESQSWHRQIRPICWLESNPTIATRTTLADQADICARAKVNAISLLGEEVLFCYSSSPILTQELDQLFRENGVSYTGSGLTDVGVCEVLTTMSSMMHQVTGLTGLTKGNVDLYGPVESAAFGVGLTPSEFQKEFPSSRSLPQRDERSYFLLFQRMDCQGIGINSPENFQTKEGVTIECSAIGKIYLEGEGDSIECEFHGKHAGVKFAMNDVPFPQMTNAAAIARDPPTGSISSDQFGYVPRYEHSK